MKILILGHKGMLGDELVKVFKKDNELTLWDRSEIDIADRKDVESKIGDLRPEAVINAAAYTAVDLAEKEGKEIAYQVNGEAVGFLAEACKKNNSVLIHYSTDYVFNGRNKNGYQEDEKRDPLNEYGQSKARGEELLQKINPKFYLIRLSWLFGINGKNFVETMLRLAKENKELRVVNDQYGKPTYAKDLAQRTRELLESKRPFGIYHLTNEGVCTWYEFAVKIFELAGIEAKVVPVVSSEFPTPAKRPAYSALVNTKLPLSRSWQGALEEYLEETGRN